MFEKFFKKKNSKKYAAFFTIGSRIEFTYRFFQYHKFHFLSLFAWCKYESINNIIKFLLNPKMILEEEFDYQNGYFIGKNTGFNIRYKKEPIEKTDDEDLYNIQIEDAKQDMKDKTEFLLYFLKNNLNDTVHKNKILYIYTVSEKDYTDPKIQQKITTLYKVLKHLNKMDFDLLVIAEKKYQNLFDIQEKNIYIRFVEKFYEYDFVSDDEKGDEAGWKEIFKEFITIKKFVKLDTIEF